MWLHSNLGRVLQSWSLQGINCRITSAVNLRPNDADSLNNLGAAYAVEQYANALDDLRLPQRNQISRSSIQPCQCYMTGDFGRYYGLSKSTSNSA